MGGVEEEAREGLETMSLWTSTLTRTGHQQSSLPPSHKRNNRFRDRRGETLFIDARKLGFLVDRVRRDLTDKDIATISDTYHAWRGDKKVGKYSDVPGFCMAAKLDDIRKHGHVLTPGRYVGAEAMENDEEPFEEKMGRLSTTLRQQIAEGRKLDVTIEATLRELGYGR